MATTPAFIAKPRHGVASLASANTAIDGTGTITTLLTGAATGTRVLEVDVKAAATSAAAVINLFISLDGGSTWHLYDSITLSAVTPSTTVASARNLLTFANLVLPDANARLGCTTTIAQATRVHAFGGDL